MKKENALMPKQHIVKLPQLALCAYVCMAFLLHLFTSQLSGTAYCLTLAFLVIVFVVTKPVILFGMPRSYLFAWIAALAVLVYNYIFRLRHAVVLIDASVLMLGFLIILFFSKDSALYTETFSVIKFMALFFAVGVLIQGLLPSVYRVIIRVFPSNLQASLSNNLSDTGKLQGFTTNPGFAAGYIVSGIFAFLSFTLRDKRGLRRKFIPIFLLTIALILTGKRGHFLFMVITIAIVRILPERGTKQLKKMWSGLMIALAAVVLFFLFQDALAQISLIRRYIVTVQGLLSGEDVSSGRYRLTAWALHLFQENPVVGIGWSVFRTTTAGNATVKKLLDTHNVYLQLLCETGIIGFTVFASVFLLSWNLARNGYCACIRSNDPRLLKWAPVLLFSFSFQTFFLLYSLSGNPLYDQFYQILYALSCSIAVAYNYVSKRSGIREALHRESSREIVRP